MLFNWVMILWWISPVIHASLRHTNTLACTYILYIAKHCSLLNFPITDPSMFIINNSVNLSLCPAQMASLILCNRYSKAKCYRIEQYHSCQKCHRVHRSAWISILPRSNSQGTESVGLSLRFISLGAVTLDLFFCFDGFRSVMDNLWR